MYSQQIVRVRALISFFCSGLFAIEGTHLRQWESKGSEELGSVTKITSTPLGVGMDTEEYKQGTEIDELDWACHLRGGNVGEWLASMGWR